MAPKDWAQDQHELEHDSGLYEEIDEHFASTTWYYELQLGRAWIGEDEL